MGSEGVNKSKIEEKKERNEAIKSRL